MRLVGTRILIASCQHAAAQELATELEACGAYVVLVDSSEAAVHRAHDLNPELAIADLTLAAMSGIETAMRIRREFPECTALILSGRIKPPACMKDTIIDIAGAARQLKCGPLLWLDLDHPMNRRTRSQPTILSSQRRSAANNEMERRIA